MKALSVKNPWAYLIIYGFDFGLEYGGFKIKDVENRTWYTAYRGPLLIHCSKKFDNNAYWDMRPHGVNWKDYNGRIIGQVNLADCVKNSKSTWAKDGMWHWVLEDPTPLENPVGVRGALGLWEADIEDGGMGRAVDYSLYRGKCREMAEALIKQNPSLRLVRGFYHCPLWGKQPHWWTVKQDGTIVDPSVAQFPSYGAGEYEEFNGIVRCEECGKELPEKSAYIDNNHAFCGDKCYGRHVGLGEYIK